MWLRTWFLAYRFFGHIERIGSKTSNCGYAARCQSCGLKITIINKQDQGSKASLAVPPNSFYVLPFTIYIHKFDFKFLKNLCKKLLPCKIPDSQIKKLLSYCSRFVFWTIINLPALCIIKWLNSPNSQVTSWSMYNILWSTNICYISKIISRNQYRQCTTRGKATFIV